MPKKYKNILILGDGNFTYTKGFVDRRNKTGKPTLARYVTTSDLISESELDENYRNNIEEIRKAGVDVLFKVDATCLEDNPLLIEEQYHRVHFNCPYPSYIESNEKRGIKDQMLREFIQKFFRSASNKQKIGDKIYITIPRPTEDESKNKYYQIRYGLYDASYQNGHKLISKRKFCSRKENGELKPRYEGYIHKQTFSNNQVEAAENSREYIFKKIAPVETIDSPQKYKVDGEERNCFKTYDTSDGSSTYSSEEIDDTEEATGAMKYLFRPTII